MPTNDVYAALSAGISQHLEIELNEQPQKYAQIFNVDTTDARFVDVQLWQGYGMPGLKNPGMQGLVGANYQSYGVRTIMQTYFLGDIIPTETWDDDKYGVMHRLIPAKGGAMAIAFRTMKEKVHANYLINNAFTATTGLTNSTPDGLSICNSAHPLSLQNATTFSNTPSITADLSIATAQFLSINIANQLAANGSTYIENKLKKVLVNPAQKYIAMKVFEGAWEMDTADRNENFLAREGVQIVEWPYFTASGATGSNNSYMGFGQEHYLMSYDRTDYNVKTDYDLFTASILMGASMRFNMRALDWRGAAGCPGK